MFLMPERAPALRVAGALRTLETRALSADDVEHCVQAVAPDEARQRLAAGGTAEWAFSLDDKARFRVRCLRHRTGLELAFRCHPLPPRPLDELALPLIVRARCRRPHGLVLVVGRPAGARPPFLRP